MATYSAFNIVDELAQALLDTDDVFKWVHTTLE